MPLKYPDIFEPNNPVVAQLDGDFVRGGVRRVVDTTALFALSSNIDQLKEKVTEVYVDSLGYKMQLVDITNINNSNGWRVAFIPLDTIPTSGSSNGITSNGVFVALNNKQNSLGYTPENLANKNIANGYSGLDGSGYIPLSLFPPSLLGSVRYEGTYNGDIVTSADTSFNGLPLPSASDLLKGIYFISTTSYVYNGISFSTLDWIICDGLSGGWNIVRNSASIGTVFNRVGNIIALSGDYSAFYQPLEDQRLSSTNTPTFYGLVSNITSTDNTMTIGLTLRYINPSSDIFNYQFRGRTPQHSIEPGTNNILLDLPTSSGTLILSSDVISQPLTGFSTGTSTSVIATDSILLGVEKLQSQINTLSGITPTLQSITNSGNTTTNNISVISPGKHQLLDTSNNIKYSIRLSGDGTTLEFVNSGGVTIMTLDSTGNVTATSFTES